MYRPTTVSGCLWLAGLALLSIPALGRAQMQGAGGGSFGGGTSISGGFGGGASLSGGLGGSISGGLGGSISGGSGGSIGGSFGGVGSSGLSGVPFGSSGSNGLGFGTTGSNFGRSGYGYGGQSGYSVSPTNAFSTYYANPMSIGLAGATVSKATFGIPLYGTTTSTTGLGTTGVVATLGGTIAISPPLAGFTTGGAGQLDPYVASVNVPVTLAPSSQVAMEASRVIQRSTALPSKNQIRVIMEGDTVVLRGWVADEHEAQLAIGLVSLTPGVHNIHSELQLQRAIVPEPPLPGR
jgi:BON domain